MPKLIMPIQLDDVIDLVIPRGSNKLVSQIKASTKIPVLGHAGKYISQHYFWVQTISYNAKIH